MSPHRPRQEHAGDKCRKSTLLSYFGALAESAAPTLRHFGVDGGAGAKASTAESTSDTALRPGARASGAAGGPATGTSAHRDAGVLASADLASGRGRVRDAGKPTRNEHRPEQSNLRKRSAEKPKEKAAGGKGQLKQDLLQGVRDKEHSCSTAPAPSSGLLDGEDPSAYPTFTSHHRPFLSDQPPHELPAGAGAATLLAVPSGYSASPRPSSAPAGSWSSASASAALAAPDEAGGSVHVLGALRGRSVGLYTGGTPLPLAVEERFLPAESRPASAQAAPAAP
ncbi:UPF0280 protein, partial [Frankliniella fusca]